MYARLTGKSNNGHDGVYSNIADCHELSARPLPEVVNVRI